jgi:hypothetical protein
MRTAIIFASMNIVTGMFRVAEAQGLIIAPIDGVGVSFFSSAMLTFVIMDVVDFFRKKG